MVVRVIQSHPLQIVALPDSHNSGGSEKRRCGSCRFLLKPKRDRAFCQRGRRAANARGGTALREAPLSSLAGLFIRAPCRVSVDRLGLPSWDAQLLGYVYSTNGSDGLRLIKCPVNRY